MMSLASGDAELKEHIATLVSVLEVATELLGPDEAFGLWDVSGQEA